jgi:ABC-type nitrate/sulfonate/bicarbonate transport system substrate-binding protein
MHALRLTLPLARLLLGLTLFVTLQGLWGCDAASPRASAPAGPAELEKRTLRYQGVAGRVLYPELAADLGYLAPLELEYIGNTISGPQDIQTVVTRDVDFGGAFNGAVIKLVAARAPIQAVIGFYGVDEHTWGGFFVLEDSPIHSARDFIGKKVAVNTLGAHQELILREYLTRGGLSKAEASQVTLVVVPPVNGEQVLRQGQVDVTTLTDFLREKAMERGKLRKVFSDYDLYGPFTAGSYVLTRDFLRDNPKTARRFVEGTSRAIEWARSAPRAEVISRMQAIIERRGRSEDVSAIKYWASTGVAGQGGLINDSEFQVWIDWLVKDAELQPGQLQPSDIYTNEFNPFQKGPA